MAWLRGIACTQTAAAGYLLEAEMEKRRRQSMVEGLVGVAGAPELVADPARFYARCEAGQARGGEVACLKGLVDGLGGQQTALDGEVDAFESEAVEESGSVADEQSAVGLEARQGEPAA